MSDRRYDFDTFQNVLIPPYPLRLMSDVAPRPHND